MLTLGVNQGSQQTPDADPVMVHCWASVVDGEEEEEEENKFI